MRDKAPIMNDNLDQLINRRSFLRRGSCAALGLAGLTSQVFNLRSVSAAVDRVAFDDYRALVCVFLFGGNDNGNTLIPWDGGDQNYADYAAQRTTLALTPSQLSPMVIDPSNTGSRRFALHPALSGLKSLFDTGDLAIMSNVGTLLYPLNRHQFRNKLVPVPAQLQAHNVQQEQWQLSRPDALDKVGWGGRIADMLQASGANDEATVSMNISIAGSSRFLSGRNVTPYAVGRNGPTDLNLSESRNRSVAEQAFLDMLAVEQDPTNPASRPMKKVIRDVTQRAIDNGAVIDGLLDQATPVPTPPDGNSLADQLEMVGRLIEFGRTGLGHQRQIFFVSMGGFDNHNGLIGSDATNGAHAARLQQVNDALVYFWNALGAINMRNSVTTFTASDFGRTYRSNGDGSDHAWAGHQFVMGGAQVDGGTVFGSFPNILLDGPDDSKNNGSFIPTTSVDAYGFEMARWMGVPLSEMSTVFPNINRFLDIHDPTTHLRILGA